MNLKLETKPSTHNICDCFFSTIKFNKKSWNNKYYSNQSTSFFKLQHRIWIIFLLNEFNTHLNVSYVLEEIFLDVLGVSQKCERLELSNSWHMLNQQR